jgi:diaminopimelate epimerase
MQRRARLGAVISAADLLVKVEGAGNDFVLGTGLWAHRLADDGELVTRLCDRHRGIGADGALALVADHPDRIVLVHRNADGSRSTFCANGTRCAARAAVALLRAPTELTVVTDWAAIPATVGPTAVSLELPPPGPFRPIRLAGPDRTWSGWRLEVGVPHLVLPVTGLATLDAASLAGPLRRHPELGDAGANVHLIEATDEGLGIRSMERGVATEVLCCGSGVVAAALVTMAGSPTRSLTVVPRSGDRLTVEALGDAPAASVRLTGPARLVAAIEPFDAG